jgi:electron transport complex protein RnfG
MNAPQADPRREILRIALSLTLVCAGGATVLGIAYTLTDRYAKAAAVQTERQALFTMMGLGPSDRVLEVEQSFERSSRRVVYRARPLGGGPGTRLEFDLDGGLVARADEPAAAPSAGAREHSKGEMPLGRLFVGQRGGQPVAFALEGETQGYKNRIRFFVALDDSFTVNGVRVLEHEEDPGLGAEVATPWFQGQFVGRTATFLDARDVTKAPMPEDWRAALGSLEREPVAAWRAAHAAQIAAHDTIYAVTGATISSRALTGGIRSTVSHFRHRWALLAPYLAGPAGGGS